MTTASRFALLIIDSQNGLDIYSDFGPSRSNPLYKSNISRLLSAFRSLPAAPKSSTNDGKPVIIHIHHHEDDPNSPLNPNSTIHPGCTDSLPCNKELPGEQVIVKKSSSAFTNTPLESILRPLQIDGLFIVGMELTGCVNSTIRAAADLNILERKDESGKVQRGKVYLVEDCAAAFQRFPPYDGPSAEVVHEVTANNLRDFVNVIKLEEALEILGVKE